MRRRAGDGGPGPGGTEKTRSDRELEKYIRTLRERKGYQTLEAWEPLDAKAGGKMRILAMEHEQEESVWLARSGFNATLAALAEALAFEPRNGDARHESA